MIKANNLRNDTVPPAGTAVTTGQFIRSVASVLTRHLNVANCIPYPLNRVSPIRRPALSGWQIGQ